MELPLIYPTEKLKSVKVSGFSMGIVKHMSNQQLFISGELPETVLASMCVGLEAEDLEGLSMVDANRILVHAWKNTHGTNTYAAKVQCECGRTNIILHNLDECVYEKSDIYDRTHKLKAINFDKMQEVEYEVELVPVPFSLQGKIISAEEGLQIQDDILWCRVKSINGKKDFDKDNLPLPLYRKITEVADGDTEATVNMMSKTVNCQKCKAELLSTLSWADADFLSGK